jgi:uncharacterized membrane protein YhaH (DUF805 family)|tara:strand:+ start:5650 stop:5976 length:327 start_codon:yes stop_codon:yes gene_type:complete
MNKYLNFNGVATRSEYWGVFVVNLVVCVILGFIAGLIMTEAQIIGAILLIVLIITSVWLTVATIARRCRDAGINPLWTLGILIPWIGTIVFIVVGCIKSTAPVNLIEN